MKIRMANAKCTSRPNLDHARAPRDDYQVDFDRGGGGAGIWLTACRPTRRHDGHPVAIAHWFSTRMVRVCSPLGVRPLTGAPSSAVGTGAAGRLCCLERGRHECARPSGSTQWPAGIGRLRWRASALWTPKRPLSVALPLPCPRARCDSGASWALRAPLFTFSDSAFRQLGVSNVSNLQSLQLAPSATPR